jgi:hypothetical protein
MTYNTQETPMSHHQTVATAAELPLNFARHDRTQRWPRRRQLIDDQGTLDHMNSPSRCSFCWCADRHGLRQERVLLLMHDCSDCGGLRAARSWWR